MVFLQILGGFYENLIKSLLHFMFCDWSVIKCEILSQKSVKEHTLRKEHKDAHQIKPT